MLSALWGPLRAWPFGTAFQLQGQLPPAQGSSWPPPILTVLEPLDAKPHQVWPVQHWEELMVHLGDELNRVLIHVLIEHSCMSKSGAHPDLIELSSVT